MSRKRARRSVSGRRWTRHREYVEVKTPFSRSGYETVYMPGSGSAAPMGNRVVQKAPAQARRRRKARMAGATVGTWWKKGKR